MRTAGFGRRFAFLMLMITAYWLVFNAAYSGFAGWDAYVSMLNTYAPWFLGHIAAMAIIAGYNGAIGYRSRAFEWLYSIYYPLHMFVIGFLRPL